jgi:hypothetical protein
MDINLDGGEKEILKAIGIGTGGSALSGRDLLQRVVGMEEAEFISTLKGLMSFGYVLADKQSFHDFKDVENAEFRINAGYARDLKEALDPRLKRERAEQKHRRVRRE